MRTRRGLFLLALPITGLVMAVMTTTPEAATGVLEDEPTITDEPAVELTSPPELAVPPRPIRVADELLEQRIVRRRRLFADFARVYAKTVRKNETERLSRMAAYAKEADLAFRRGEFDVARRYAEAAVIEDPDSEAAQRLVRLATDAAAEAARHTIATRACAEGWDDARRRLDELARPPAEPYDVIDSNPNMATRAEDDVDETSVQAAVVATLEKTRVRGLSFHDQNLDNVVTWLRSSTGLPFHLTPEVRRARFDDVRITVPGLDDVSISWLLTNIVTTPYDLVWEVRDGVVTIATKDEVRPPLRLKYFDTKDLAVKIQNFRGNEIFLSPSNGYVPPDPPELEEPEPIFPADPLVEAIRSAVDPGTWDDRGASIDLKNGTLIVKHTPAAIESVRLFLDLLRESLQPASGRPTVEFHSIAPRGEDEAATPPPDASTPDR